MHDGYGLGVGNQAVLDRIEPAVADVVA